MNYTYILAFTTPHKIQPRKSYYFILFVILPISSSLEKRGKIENDLRNEKE